jgi:hypothetical protein
VIHFDDGDVQDLDLTVIKWNSLEMRAEKKKASGKKAEKKAEKEHAQPKEEAPKSVFC